MRTFKPLRQVLTASPLLASLVLWLCASGTLAAAAADDSDDPPDRVARLSYLKGDVSLKPAGTNDWALASLNRPLTTDDQLSLDRNARAELQAGSAIIHLDAGTAFSFSELSDDVLQARVTDGAIHLTVRRLQNDEVIEIDTPHAAITVIKPGDYRIEVVDDGASTLVKTYSGEIEVAGNRESVRVGAREQVRLGESGQAVAASFTPRDAFDSWAQERNERFSRSASSRYVAPDVIGYEDLDSYGDWTSETEYGYVWYPRIAVGWSPYRDGHWAWVSPWGWTWVDDAPWGFAPFHYGRWAHLHGRWGWVPGPMHVRAVYAPALVAWVGGPHIGMSVSFGSHIGWFPLAPREVYVPGYYCSRRHITKVNYANTLIVNNTIINRAYANRSTRIDYQHRGVRDAVTVVSRDTFVSARPVANHLVRDRDMRTWQTHNASPAIAPDRASTLGPRWNANESRVPERWDRRANREVIARHTPPPQRASFEQEQRAIRENNNRPIPRADLRSNARISAQPNTGGAIEQRPGQGRGQSRDQVRDDRPRRVFDRSQEEARPSMPQTNDAVPNSRRERDVFRSNNRAPSSVQEAAPAERIRPERETPRVEPPRAREQLERQPERQRESVERQRPVERAERVEAPRVESPRAEAPRRFEPPPQREQRAEPEQRQAPAPASEQREERHDSPKGRRVPER